LEGAAHPEDVWEEDRVADPPLDVVLVLALNDAALDDAVLEDVEADLLVNGVGAELTALEVGLLAVHELSEVAPGVAVQVLGVGGVERVLLALQPAAGQVGDGNVAHRVLPDQGTPAGQQR